MAASACNVSATAEATNASYVRGLWLRSVRPDENLGRHSIGPSPHQLSYGSVRNVLDLLEMKQGVDRFIDLGSGKGLVMAMALSRYRIPVCGIDIDATQVGWARRRIQGDQMLIHPSLLSYYWYEYCWDLKNMKSGALRNYGVTAAYSFDKDFPPEVLQSVLHLLRHSSISRFVCTQTPSWAESQSGGVLTYTYKKVVGRICGSGERHTFYLYKVSNCRSTGVGACLYCRAT